MSAKGIFETEIDKNVALYDVSGLLPVKGRGYGRRSVKVQRIILHKSGANGPAGFRGIQGSARYFVEQYRGHGAPGFPYHFWLSREPDLDSEGRIVVYRGNSDDTHSWHTGKGNNVVGIAVALQGVFDGDGGAIEVYPTQSQMIALEAIVPWLADRFGLDVRGSGPLGRTLTGHWENGKPVCPGDAVVEWIQRQRGRTSVHPVAGPFPVEARQHALAWLKLLPWKAVGEPWSYDDRAALEAFQTQAKLKPDGWWGPKTEAAIRLALGTIDRSTMERLMERPV